MLAARRLCRAGDAVPNVSAELSRLGRPRRTPSTAEGLAIYRVDAPMVRIVGWFLLVVGLGLATVAKGFPDWRFTVCGLVAWQRGGASCCSGRGTNLNRISQAL
jgi:hypothetical protein